MEIFPIDFEGTIIGTKVRLRKKSLSDATNDYAWETDPDLARLDAAIPQKASFSRYLSDYTSALHRSFATRYSLAIETLDGRFIGNCVCYGINEHDNEAELGILIGDRDYWNKGYGTDAVTTLVNYIFHQTLLDRLFLKTLDWNIRAQQCFLKCGFTPYGYIARDSHNFLLMEINRKKWERHHKQLRNTIDRA